MKTTKVEAVRKVLQDNDGSADWTTIYKQIGKYNKKAKASDYWQEGIRGVVYREQRYGRHFKVKDGIVSLI
jgi:hypothetical protein